MTPERVRELTGWPTEVPDALLEAHLSEAARALSARVPADRRTGQDWIDAQAWAAAATAAPLIHAFALSGAAKVGRLEGAVEWRFLTPAEAAAFAAHCAAMRDGCLARLMAGAVPAGVVCGGVFLAAV